MFAGDRFALGGVWSGECIVQGLDYFVDTDFSNGSAGHDITFDPHITKQMKLPKGGERSSPLKRWYSKAWF